MNSKTSIIIAFLSLAIIFGSFLYGCKKKEGTEQQGTQQEKTEQPMETETVKKAPDFTLESFSGEQISLSDYKDKIVILEWVNDECPFSLYHYDKAKTMIDLAEKYKNDDVVWLAINSTSYASEEQVKNFAEKYNVPYPILDDRSGKVGRAYGALTTPHMFIINKKGNIVYEGAIDNAPLGEVKEGEQMVSYVDKALSELTSGEEIITPKTVSYGCPVKYAD